ncbi:MAG: trehalase family glycosidase [Spirochaetales bacterium]
MVDFSRLPEPLVPGHPEWKALYELAWTLAEAHIRTVNGRGYIDAAWDGKRNFQWVWDTCFIAFYTRYAPDRFPGIDGLDNFYELQRADGYLGMTYDMTTGLEPWPNRINPPLFAWAEWEHFRLTGDDSRLARAVHRIGKFMEWIEANRRTAPHSRLRETSGQPDPFQLFFFEDCGSSGMDDSPRTPRNPEAGAYFDWIDLSAQMALSYRMLANMAAQLDQKAKAEAWARRGAEIGALVNDELWCAADRFYHDRMLPRNFVSAKTIAGFWPLVAGYCPAERVDDLVGHLENRAEFARSIPVPSLAADDPNYRGDGVFWRGGVWAPANYMVLQGLAHCGRREVAHRIARRYLEGLVRVHDVNEPHTLWENVAPDLDRPGLKPYGPGTSKPDFVGWSGLGPISMLIEHVLGLEVDAVAGTVVWDLRLEGPHGLKRLPVGRDKQGSPDFVDVTCEAPADDNSGPASVTLRGTRELKVELHRGGRTVVVRLVAGVEWTGVV